MEGALHFWLRVVFFACLSAHSLRAAALSDSQWQPDFCPPGVDGPIYAAYSQGTNLYVGGQFTHAGGVPARNVARFDGHRWYPVGEGIDGPVRSLAGDYNGLVYAGGSFTRAGTNAAQNIAAWDGAKWSSLGGGISGPVAALTTSGLTLLVGGKFATAGQQTANGIAQWNGTAWSTFGDASAVGVDGEVSALVFESGESFFIGGRFTRAGNVSAASLARWDGTAWRAVGGGVAVTNAVTPTPGRVNALAWVDQVLTVAGQFQIAGSVPAANIAQWNGEVWSGFGAGLSGGASPVVRGLLRGGSLLAVAGTFSLAGTTPVSGTAKWDYELQRWSPLSTDLEGPTDVELIAASSGGSVVIAGDFTLAAGVQVNHVAYWDGGNSFTSLGQGVKGDVHALEVVNNNLYIGGQFDRVAGALANGLAVSGVTYPRWLAVGAGVDGVIRTLVSSQYRILVGGDFTRAAGEPVQGFAQTDGLDWHTNLGGMDGDHPSVWTIASVGDDRRFYVGGDFSAAGGVAAQNIAYLDGSVWAPLGQGLNGPVHAILIEGDHVWVGGAFTTAGGLPAHGVARWDSAAQSWSALGAGIDDLSNSAWTPEVHALLRVGSDLYVGGRFDRAGGKTTSSLARWDGTAWFPLVTAEGNGVTGTVRALASRGGEIYVGGEFTAAGGVPGMFNIARWDGSGFTALGSGTDGPVRALAVHFNTLFLGGSFRSAGGQPAAGLARWQIAAPPTITVTTPTTDSSFAHGAIIPVTVSLAGFTPPPAYVSFYMPPNPLITVSNAPFATTLSNLVAGRYGLTAYAYDAKGDSVNSSDVQIVVRQPEANAAPQVVLTSPLDGGRYAVGESVTLTAEAEDVDGAIDRVEFYIGHSFQSPIGLVTNPPYTLTLPITFPGEYPFVARVIDRQGASTVSSNRVVVTFLASNFPPTVDFEDPFDGALLLVGTPVPLVVTTADRDGQAVRVDLSANDAPLVSFQGAAGPTYRYVWSPPAPGEYQIAAKVRDNAGAATTTTLRIAVVEPGNIPPPRVMAAPGRRSDYPTAEGPVNAVLERDGILYLGGEFTKFGGQSRRGLAALDLRTGGVTAWNPECDGVVYSLAAGTDGVFVGGSFSNLAGQSRRNLAAVDPDGHPTAFNPAVEGPVLALLRVGNRLYLGGAFAQVAGLPRAFAAAVESDSGQLLPWEPRPNGVIRVIHPGPLGLYLGGDFTTLHGVNRGYLAEVDVSTGLPTAFDCSTDGPVWALAGSGTTLFVGGEFRTIQGHPRDRLAAVDRLRGRVTGWVVTADGTVRALAQGDDVLYAGGAFTQAGGAARPGLAALDVRLKAPQVRPGFPGADEGTLATSVRTLFLGKLALYAGGTAGADGLGPAFRAYDLPLRFEALERSGGGSYRWMIQGPAGHSAQVQRSVDLEQWTLWDTQNVPFVLEFPLTGGAAYRAVLNP